VRRPALGREFVDSFRYRLDVLPLVVVRRLAESPLNPTNTLDVAERQISLYIRPDLALSGQRLELSLKPRYDADWTRSDEGPHAGHTRTESEVYVNGWLVRYMLIEGLFVSYGRENLQWGPSYLLSPSNPFNMDTGRDNPELEQPGLDCARLVWVPGPTWTASLIANTSEGRRDSPAGFEPTFAAKADYTGERRYASLIVSRREHAGTRAGCYGGLSASDALLLYAEGSIGTDDRVRILGGASYALETGPTLSLECYRNANGCTADDLGQCYLSTDEGAPGDSLVRKDYLLLQYLHTHIGDALDLVVRWVAGLDDPSSRLIAIAEHNAGRHGQWFAVGTLGTGDTDSEFGSLVENSLMVGFRISL
jgi:hypothetical protein